MKFIDWIAVLGALAWTPHLIGMIKTWLTKSRIRVLTNRAPEIGFTTHGSILNIRIAFAVENKDIVVSDLKIRLKHESGEERTFEWQGITQHVGKMTTPDAGVMPFEKEQSVLAIKLNQKEIEERFIRCQEAVYISSKQQYEESAIKKMSYLKSENKYDPESFLREQEMTELYSFNKHAFPWKQGKYRVSVEIKSPEEFEIVDSEMEFLLNPIDVEELSKNKDLIEGEYRRMLIGTEKAEKDVVWQWRYPTLTTI
ncbi:hypothetical protein EHN06_09005 [Marinobacter sp. NP-4(2019)]|uniref:hypothetical protein n=1 Tax=Marinobacter sp. NP-4(2019) TaxID=2488665 RepID=UPI000FC3E3A9|nr:hypothetical protein [Marinobacter sp. NP-4(2019)]AZT83666.1 hypothetical protein EHN06_09005 [Marinobacter sp. NP-4(2019)]